MRVPFLGRSRYVDAFGGRIAKPVDYAEKWTGAPRIASGPDITMWCFLILWKHGKLRAPKGAA